jgi:hypothetical protein
MMRRFYDSGVTELNGHLLYALPDGEYAAADAWLQRHGIQNAIAEAAKAWQDGAEESVDALFDKVESQFVDVWQVDAGLQTYGEAVGDLLDFREREGEPAEMSATDWRKFAARAPLYSAREKAKALGADVAWDCERAKTPEGYTRSAAASRTRSPSRWPRAVRRHPGWGDENRRPRRRPAVRRRDPRRVPRPDAGLQPVPCSTGIPPA